MFVVPREALPKEPVFPANLEELGYQITEADQLRSIADPSQPFRYRLNANERYNEVRKEALNECVRDIVLSRLHDLGMQELRLPLNAPPKSPHVAILISPNLSAKKRVIVVFGEPYQDLGIWAYRTIGNETVNSGSAVDFVKEALSQGKGKGDKDEDGPGLVIANLGQLVWHCRGERAVSLPTWDALPRKTAVDPPLKMTARNYVPGNETWQDHVDYVFENVLGKLLAKDAKIDIIGVAEGGHGALNYLSQNWPNWSTRISAICLANPLTHTRFILSPEVADFLGKRGRAYVISEKELDMPVSGRSEFGVNCYSSGESGYVECIMPQAYKRMLSWLNIMHKVPGLQEKALMQSEVEGVAGEEWDYRDREVTEVFEEDGNA